MYDFLDDETDILIKLAASSGVPAIESALKDLLALVKLYHADEFAEMVTDLAGYRRIMLERAEKITKCY